MAREIRIATKSPGNHESKNLSPPNTKHTKERRIQVRSAKEVGEDENSAHKSELIRFKSPEGTRRIGPPFPTKSLTRFQQSMDKINSNERNRGRETQGRRPGETESPRTDYKSRT